MIKRRQDGSGGDGMTATDRNQDGTIPAIFRGTPSFSLRHRLHRAVWQAVWLMLARWTPPVMRPWRLLLLTIFGARVHPTASVYASAVVWYPPNLTMDAYASLGPGTVCYSMDRIHIGERAVISQRAHLCGGSHRVDDPEFTLLALPITISADAWIAAEAFVGPGVTIGEGAVLGARGVTVKDLEPWTIYAGNPARKLRPRVFGGTSSVRG
jgi:putative colanic acid biosynthesis acetyltransferase WcaF